MGFYFTALGPCAPWQHSEGGRAWAPAQGEQRKRGAVPSRCWGAPSPGDLHPSCGVSLVWQSPGTLLSNSARMQTARSSPAGSFLQLGHPGATFYSQSCGNTRARRLPGLGR